MSKATSFNTRWQSSDVTIDVLKRSREVFNLPSELSDLVLLPPPDPMEFENPEEFRISYWRAEMWSKFPFDVGIDRRAAAMQSFFENEHRCERSNRDLYDLWSRPIPERYRSILRRAQSLLEHLFSGFTADEIVAHVAWGPGATTSLRRARATPQNKWVSCSHLTDAALPYYYAFQRWSGWVFPRPVIVEGNKVVTVPKNSKTERTIAIEPDWNMFFQLGLGGAIRSRLQRRFGVLHGNSQGINRCLARKGSIDGFLATIDLKGASDSISLSLVDALVPPSVKQHLFALRSPKGVLPGGETITYEKISSMGNGFTFELETAIFYAVCRAAAGHACVYGDDIVVPSSSAPLVLDILRFIGFDANEKKTFYSSRFRESCGGHYFAGVDVTPPYVRKPLVGLTRLAFANRMSELSDNGSWRWGFVKPIHDAVCRGVPRKYKGPVGVDGVLHVPFDEACPTWSSRYQTFTGFRLVQHYWSDPAPVIGAYLQALHGAPGFTQWQKPPGLTGSLREGTWYQHYQGLSPWASL